METARMTRHARARCAEMGISTKVAKEILRRADITRPSNYPGQQDVRIAVSNAPTLNAYAVVYYPSTPPLVVTVVFRTEQAYRRCGITFNPIEEDSCPT